MKKTKANNKASMIGCRKVAKDLLKAWKTAKSSKDSDALLIDMIADEIYSKEMEIEYTKAKYYALMHFLSALPTLVKNKIKAQADKELKLYQNEDGEWTK